jgi:hypothetical protein
MTYLIAFLSVAVVSGALHYYVYRNYKRVLLRDFPVRGPKLLRWVRVLFFVMEIPFVLMFFRKQIPGDVSLATILILFPFTIWQFLMFVWGMVLLPQTLFRILRKGFRKLRGESVVSKASLRSESNPMEINPLLTPSYQSNVER